VESPCWCSSEGHQHGGHKVTETSKRFTDFKFGNIRGVAYERKFKIVSGIFIYINEVLSLEKFGISSAI